MKTEKVKVLDKKIPDEELHKLFPELVQDRAWMPVVGHCNTDGKFEYDAGLFWEQDVISFCLSKQRVKEAITRLEHWEHGKDAQDLILKELGLEDGK